MPLWSSRRMGEYYMPQILKIGPYVVYFWSNEGAPLEPVKPIRMNFNTTVTKQAWKERSSNGTS